MQTQSERERAELLDEIDEAAGGVAVRVEATVRGGYAPDTRTFWQRLLARLFPVRPMPIPDDSEGWAQSYMETHVVARLGWCDRLRVLFSGKVHVQTLTKTDVLIGKSHSDASVWVDAL